MSYYTADPAADALRYDDAMQASADATEARLVRYQAEIADAFASFSAAPIVYADQGKVRYQPFAEAVSDMLADDQVFSKLLEALQTSSCPKVKAVLTTCAERYSAQWADLCAGAA